MESIYKRVAEMVIESWLTSMIHNPKEVARIRDEVMESFVKKATSELNKG